MDTQYTLRYPTDPRLWTPEGRVALAMQIVTEDGLRLKDLPENYRKNRKIVLAAVEQNGLALEHAPEFQDDREIVRAAVIQCGGFSLKFASERFKHDREIVLIAWAVRFCALEEE